MTFATVLIWILDQLSYPNLHGEWAFYDSHSDKSWSLNIELEKSNRGKYVLWYKWDGDESWKREEKGDLKWVSAKINMEIRGYWDTIEKT